MVYKRSKRYRRKTRKNLTRKYRQKAIVEIPSLK